MVDVALAGFSSIFVDNLEIEPELVGATLTFEHEGRAVELRPPLELEGRDYYSCSRRRDGRPVTYEVNRVHLRVELGEKIDFPAEILGQQVNASGIPPETQEQLEQARIRLLPRSERDLRAVSPRRPLEDVERGPRTKRAAEREGDDLPQRP
jgi:hypothetical protein